MNKKAKKILLIVGMIVGLYLVAEKIVSDKTENDKKFTKQNRETITESDFSEEPLQYISIRERLFKETCWVDERFVSTEKVEGNDLAKLEKFHRYSDKQEGFNEFVPSFSVENFLNDIQVKYGIVSYEEFVSCIGTCFQEYPASIEGMITEVSIDLNADGRDEKLVLISKDQLIYLQVYSESNGKYVLCCERHITSIDYCSQQNISLFYNSQTGRYLLFVDGSTEGAYTGNDTKYASVYEIDCTQINLVCEAVADSYGLIKDDIDSQLVAFGVPYAKNCSQINNITNSSQYKELLEIRHKYINDDLLGGWSGGEHHLQFLTPEKRSGTMETVQS